MQTKRLLRRLDVGGQILSKWLLGKQDGLIWTGLIWLRIETSGRQS
jgi:hypothetical protein